VLSVVRKRGGGINSGSSSNSPNVTSIRKKGFSNQGGGRGELRGGGSVSGGRRGGGKKLRKKKGLGGRGREKKGEESRKGRRPPKIGEREPLGRRGKSENGPEGRRTIAQVMKSAGPLGGGGRYSSHYLSGLHEGLWKECHKKRPLKPPTKKADFTPGKETGSVRGSLED